MRVESSSSVEAVVARARARPFAVVSRRPSLFLPVASLASVLVVLLKLSGTLICLRTGYAVCRVCAPWLCYGLVSLRSGVPFRIICSHSFPSLLLGQSHHLLPCPHACYPLSVALHTDPYAHLFPFSFPFGLPLQTSFPPYPFFQPDRMRFPLPPTAQRELFASLYVPHQQDVHWRSELADVRRFVHLLPLLSRLQVLCSILTPATFPFFSSL
jgi:hypothetical protein